LHAGVERLDFGIASTTVAVADFMMREWMLDQPTIKRVFLHEGLVFTAGLSAWLLLVMTCMLPSAAAATVA